MCNPNCRLHHFRRSSTQRLAMGSQGQVGFNHPNIGRTSPQKTHTPSRRRGRLKYRHDRRQHARECRSGKDANRANHQPRMGCKQFAGPGEAGCQQAAGGEVWSVQRRRRRVAIGATRDLAKYPIAAPGVSQTAGRSLDCDKSENGNGTRTTSPAVGVTTPRPPPAETSRRPGPLPRAARPRPVLRPALPRPSLTLAGDCRR